MKPILFNGESVHAILEGRKTQTRRVIKPQPDVNPTLPAPTLKRLLTPDELARECPYGSPGSQLWVRETFIAGETYGTEYGGWPYESDEIDGPLPKDAPQLCSGTHPNGIWMVYRATEPDFEPCYGWRPSIHMPRWASRITLEITDVRVEQIQDISSRDIIEEGIEQLVCLPPTEAVFQERTNFVNLWNKINEKRGHSFESNPWLWCLEFKVVTQ